MKGKKKPPEKKVIFLAEHREAPKYTIVFMILLYLLMYFCTAITARSGLSVPIGGSELPLSACTGVFSSLGNICLVIMVLFYKRTGFFAAIILLLLGLPSYISGMLMQHNLVTISGIFSTVFTLLMLKIVHTSHTKLENGQLRMQNLFEETATALVNAIDTKDKYTHGHSARVAEYSRRLAEMDHRSEEECMMIYYTALLHDVGKIGVPNTIINKAGRLTDEEYAVIKQHPANGAQILETISDYPFLSIGAHYHHERYDGKGYPEGLKGEEIPEIARIIAVADAYDAMTSIRSYRDPISQDEVREQIVTGIGTQFDPHFARLMLRLIDVDTEYAMKEKAITDETDGTKGLTVGDYRSAVADGILVTQFLTTIRMSVTSDDEAIGIAPVPSMILFDALDGVTHKNENEIRERLYFEYGEIWFDGRTETAGARVIQSRTEPVGDPDITVNGEYKIEAVRIRDHARIRVSGKTQTVEAIVALPDSTRYLYIGLTGEHCHYGTIHISKAAQESPADLIPRIAERISYIDTPAGDLPNVQVDGFRTDAADGVEIRDGLRITFHTKSLPTSRLVWHCPFVDMFCADDGKVNGANYRDLAFIRFDGECWENDARCTVDLNVRKTEQFGSWDAWKQHNLEGYDAAVTFRVEGSRITVITENAGIAICNTVAVSGIDRPIYAALTGDQVALTNICIHTILHSIY